MANTDAVRVWSQLFQDLQCPSPARNPLATLLGFRDLIRAGSRETAWPGSRTGWLEVAAAPAGTETRGRRPLLPAHDVVASKLLIRFLMTFWQDWFSGNQALEQGEAHTSIGMDPGSVESFLPSFGSKQCSMTGAEQMWTGEVFLSAAAWQAVSWGGHRILCLMGKHRSSRPWVYSEVDNSLSFMVGTSDHTVLQIFKYLPQALCHLILAKTLGRDEKSMAVDLKSWNPESSERPMFVHKFSTN